ncbi:Imm45 family immunity protein [Paraburkholderia diazotrophica]|uniref:Immunity protein 45 n=1 Tax=Paraburkholderia diazotrophica TaxID=667676 RepID=A0A1H7CLR5_9BURK|nr:Imm45 family immunity protein [Paraburkholderia diazotrophica]SEJ87640.1 Immunity protein 45 [Paraburkholderia diazotrophica]
MTNWKKLVDRSESELQRGTLLRFPAGHPFEGNVVMMVCESPDKSGLGLITITGYKAGINCYVGFPKEAGTATLSVEWIVNNWRLWVWPDGDVDHAEYRNALEADEII